MPEFISHLIGVWGTMSPDFKTACILIGSFVFVMTVGKTTLSTSFKNAFQVELRRIADCFYCYEDDLK